MELKLQGKRALVTGSSSGIGEGIAKCLAKEGVHVMVHGRKEDELQRVVEEIKKAGGQARYVKGDLADDNEAKSVADKTLEAFQGLDILVNNAGAFPKRGWTEGKPKEWLELFNINVVSMVRMIQFFIPKMKAQKWGRILQIASVGGIMPSPSLPDYGVTKAANINMTISLAKELGGTGITVNSISPGPILTSGFRDLLKQVASERGWKGDFEEIEKIAAKEFLPTFLGRFGRPEDIGNLAAYLSSPLADFITGANYRVDGGRF